MCSAWVSEYTTRNGTTWESLGKCSGRNGHIHYGFFGPDSLMMRYWDLAETMSDGLSRGSVYP